MKIVLGIQYGLSCPAKRSEINLVYHQKYFKQNYEKVMFKLLSNKVIVSVK